MAERWNSEWGPQPCRVFLGEIISSTRVCPCTCVYLAQVYSVHRQRALCFRMPRFSQAGAGRGVWVLPDTRVSVTSGCLHQQGSFGSIMTAIPRPPTGSTLKLGTKQATGSPKGRHPRFTTGHHPQGSNSLLRKPSHWDKKPLPFIFRPVFCLYK